MISVSLHMRHWKVRVLVSVHFIIADMLSMIDSKYDAIHYFQRGDPGMVAFAHGGDTKVGTSFLDLSTGEYLSVRENWVRSDPLCVQFRRNNDVNQVLYGHRNGSISLVDSRSLDALCAVGVDFSGASFGSATTLRSLQKDNLVLAKGSFGSCRIFDIRRFRSSTATGPKDREKSMLLELTAPTSLVHQTKSVRCVGLAMDPTETVAISPFAGQNDDVLLAVWSISTGRLLRTINVDSFKKRMCADDHTDIGISAFCELSSVVTDGFEMLFKNEYDAPVVSSRSETWGLWFKSMSVAKLSPADGGGIHHLLF